ncbi:MAG TPA: methyltransferase domain-containing protein [Chryseolinea sp.]|nr:methyltransferase domain-containing protein [Chryseolinea sp.]
MNIEPARLRIDVTDDEFDAIYPRKIRRLAEKHFTPVSVAKTASEFLVTKPGERVLDIGSGAGKFCLVGSVNTSGHFVGIEQRRSLVELSKKLSTSYGLNNITFVNGDVTSINFNEYDAFYIYNSFYENLNKHDSIDDTILMTPSLYNSYLRYTHGQLSRLSPAVRLVTYYTSYTIVPSSFKLIDSLHDEHLKLWEKVC